MTRTLTRVAAENFLSLRNIDVDLNDLTVLVGPNGSGKSNFLNIFRFIGEIARSDLLPAIEAMGGLSNLTFRGVVPPSSKLKQQTIRITLEGMMTEHASEQATDRYTLGFSQRNLSHYNRERMLLSRYEQLFFKRKKGRGRRITLKGGNVTVLNDRPEHSAETKLATLKVQQESSGLAILRRLGEQYEAPQVDAIASLFEQLRLFDVNVNAARLPSAISESRSLNQDSSNLAAFLEWLSQVHPETIRLIEEDVRFVLPGFEKFVFTRLGGSTESVRLDIVERHLREVTPLGRASFGTIRSIALFAMLHDPNPPRLTCLEEVDHGLHPHALDRLVERLREASSRTQIIVATHSPALLNRISPSEVVIFERDPQTGATVQPAITADEIARMERESGYRLGELWFSGLLGGGLATEL
jgi:predicted ATPase